MNQARIVIVGLGLSSLSILFACSGGDAEQPGNALATEDVKPAPTKGGASSGEAKPANPATVPATGSSGGASSGADPVGTDAGGADAGGATAVCLQTCATSNPKGAKEFSDILVPCACDDDVCGAVCGTTCDAAGGASAQDLLVSSTDACKACVQNSVGGGGACQKAELQNCPKKSSCPAFALCAQSCL